MGVNYRRDVRRRGEDVRTGGTGERMEKREKIIRELEVVKRRVARLDHFEEEAETIEDAIALLKEQQETIWALEIDLDDTLDVMCEYAEKLKAREPRVMTLEEIPYAVFGWMELSWGLIPCVLEDVYVDDTVGFASIEDGHDYMSASDY